MLTSTRQNTCEAIWLEHEPYIRQLCNYKLSSHPEEAEDCAADVFLQLVIAFEENKEIHNVRAWLRGVALHKIMDCYTRINRKKETHLLADISELSHCRRLSVSPDYIDLLLKDSDCPALVAKVKEQLTKDELDLLVRVYQEGQQLVSISKELSLTHTAVQQRHYRLRKKVGALVKKHVNHFYDRA